MVLTCLETAHFHLYKILAPEDWEESKALGYVKPLAMDAAFIHLCTKDQVDHIIAKYWKNHSQLVVLSLDPTQFQGRLVKEKNPGGATEYFHLYGGRIPLTAVVQSVHHGVSHAT